MSLKERLKESRKKAKKTQLEVAEAVKMSQPAYQALESGRNQKSAFLPLIADFLGVDPYWLTTGTTSESNQSEIARNKSNSSCKGDIHFAPVEFRSADTKGRPGNVRIPIYKDVKASCGSGIENFLEDASDYLEIDPVLLKLMGVQINPSHLKIIYSAEYSMYPTVAPDSPLFVDVSDKDPNNLKNGNVYVFTHNHELRMKRVFVSYGSNTVKLTSDNPDKNRYPDEFITNEQLNEINFVGRLELALVKP
ncbi:XRE family transcriptional regulator [Acinetobacter sichuanensis]|uniref:LexA family transcriptional regulator n=1 Tax=Acinetobacter sichuanensis TaxID=2136183 RepID=A0A371YJE3_9GAMM|nr:XRE family transcriptional regulator [Acinetobacter sichuanensis]RFC81591.1 LexA family transcriptional regulator [Acinetobacter sichuanensis]